MQSNTSDISNKGASPLVLVVGVIIVLGILAAAGWWYLSSARFSGPDLQQGIPGGVRPLPPLSTASAVPSPAGDAATQQLSSQGSTDDPDEISKDLNATDLSGLDSEMATVGTTLQ